MVFHHSDKVPNSLTIFPDVFLPMLVLTLITLQASVLVKLHNHECRLQWYDPDNIREYAVDYVHLEHNTF
jgi:hypothetical protein